MTSWVHVVVGCAGIVGIGNFVVTTLTPARTLDLTPAQLNQGAAVIRAQGYPCPAVTGVRELSAGTYRVECGASAYRVTLSVTGLTLRPLR